MIEKLMIEYNARVNAELSAFLSVRDERYPVIFDSMSYSVNNGGKRIRPLLVLLFSESFGAEKFDKTALRYACALEMVHTYSLIHDDLPCMDDDDLRRGKPTNHKVFGEAVATLSGDALLTYAFEVISGGKQSGAQRRDAVTSLAQNAGTFGMIGGQVLDMLGENRKLTYEEFRLMNDRKTGALIRCAALLGVIAAGVHTEQAYKTASDYATGIGSAFQITDDILDVTGDEAVFGKPIGSDAENGKTTVFTYMDLPSARALAEKYTSDAINAAEGLPNGETLRKLAEFLLNRKK